ncbi:TPA: type II toxin-antitoxin system RelB/DinJ family antitoxin [Escherichia coli]|uniref:type II toxin-antitoxin system RelB/DinJ family antitoxin n=3 Tax=Escherichia coli TaxID=562 RepID=UPI00069AE8C4|nr:type II toxin-antitoxin system RelB/DinJ family antitoxin [Escherichia coli]EIC8564081.1 type II toxin-antitoxin system RelB/DinJ family antitoxin [Escherichia coli]EMB1663045.1 type II toxin-antitoxin system RelB/DinJ family antitoxin [Escherichia coli]HBH7996400.1 type II toxin-antitoxin system RelB/DinJ family antitoxin [Escherichia coli]
MTLSQISVRIDDELKQRTDEKMKLLGTNPTQAITLLYQYIAENGKLPFTVSTQLFTSEDYTQKLITTVRSIYEYWRTLSETSATTRTKSGMAYSMAMAAHVSKLHSDLIHNCGTLSGEEVASLMIVMEDILSTPPSFYRGEAPDQVFQDKLNAADQTILMIEKCHGMNVQRGENFYTLR